MRRSNTSKKHTKGESHYVMFTRHYESPEEIAGKSLSDYTVSSTVTYGPDAILLKFLLESLNEACLSNQPETVASITKSILEYGLSEYMDISKMEIILANTRAVTLMHPDVPVKDYYETLLHMFYQVHTIN